MFLGVSKPRRFNALSFSNAQIYSKPLYLKLLAKKVPLMSSLDKLTASLKTGEEPLRFNGAPTSFKLIDFWKWSVSNILSNATRGRFAEFIVASATNIDTTQVRDEWAAYDLVTAEAIKIEVKSAAYIQSWFQKSLSKISFIIKR